MTATDVVAVILVGKNSVIRGVKNEEIPHCDIDQYDRADHL